MPPNSQRLDLSPSSRLMASKARPKRRGPLLNRADVRELVGLVFTSPATRGTDLRLATAFRLQSHPERPAGPQQLAGAVSLLLN
jgi:hypothetical protein